MQHENKRELRVNFEKNRLHASFLSAVRRMKIPRMYRGLDLIRGTVIGLVRHPEYDIDKAVAEAAEMCKMTGNVISTDDALLEIADCLVIGLSTTGRFDEKQLSEVEDILDIGILDAEERKKLKDFVEQEVQEIVYTIKKDFCYEKSFKYLLARGWKIHDLQTEFLKNMLFKKLIADDSTQECMYEYAYRKTCLVEVKKCPKSIDEEIFGDTMPKLLQGMSPYDYVNHAADEIYSENCMEETPAN